MPGSFPYIAEAINDVGVVVGVSGYASAPSLVPTIWNGSTLAAQLTVPGTYEGAGAEGVTPSGEVLGYVVYAGTFYAVPVIWSEGVLSQLPCPAPIAKSSHGTGTITVGTSFRPIGDEGFGNKQLIFWQNRQFVAEVDLPGESEGFTGINSSGTFVGSYFVDGRYHAFTGEGTNVRELYFGDLNQPSTADINEDGTILGNYSPDDVNYKGVIKRGEDLQILEPLPGYTSSPVGGINERGEVVGGNWDAGQANRIATYYEPGSSQPIDMNTLADLPEGVHLFLGRDINNRGQILAWGDSPTGWRFFVLNPIPEPATLTATTMAACLLARRRRSGSTPRRQIPNSPLPLALDEVHGQETRLRHPPHMVIHHCIRGL